ncbi:hypothetical protein [uncultured Parolsenella sp.]|uniref:hypothetical protein n=1 Tax=uncultured Parolsenella sp. TaxID=2083008 RepID=UPI0027DCB732|nr:hypothetical protein [uncultured Parolsenella sp.]
MTGSEAGSALVGVLVVVSLVCFVLYYRLGPAASFADGTVPPWPWASSQSCLSRCC